MILLNLKFHFRGNGYTKSPPFWPAIGNKLQ
jgi:hypothetical protein